MKSIILCEGSTDFALLQYYMRTVYGWNDGNSNGNTFQGNLKRSRMLRKREDSLQIGGCGGCNRIVPAFEYILEINSISAGTEAFDKIVIITDRDEVETEKEFIENVKKKLAEKNVSAKEEICNNKWISCEYTNGQGKKRIVQVLILVIPFEETGAMETFLLNAIAQDNPYDENIIEQCNEFVDSIDEEKRYLAKRRYITKAKFDVYFSVRTAAEQFVERQNILKSVEWEKYTLIQKSFEKLGDLSSEE